jgi:hypothetical protein
MQSEQVLLLGSQVRQVTVVHIFIMQAHSQLQVQCSGGGSHSHWQLQLHLQAPVLQSQAFPQFSVGGLALPWSQFKIFLQLQSYGWQSQTHSESLPHSQAQLQLHW